MTLLAAGAAGFLLWFAPHFNRWSTDGYWGVIGLVALAGVLIGVSQLHGRDGNPGASFLVAFVPVFVAAGWVIVALEPRRNWVRDHALSWSNDIGIGHAVHNLGEHVTVLAFGLGVVFGVTFEPRMVRRRARMAVAVPAVAVVAPTPEPTLADPGWGETTAVEPPAREPQEDVAHTVELAGSTPQPTSADTAGEDEPTIVRPPAEQRHEDAPTVVSAESSSQPAAPDPAEQPTVVEPPAAEPEGSENGPALPPA
jgi:hypothetical protein